MEFINFNYAGLADYGRVINRDNTLAFQAIHGDQLHPEKNLQRIENRSLPMQEFANVGE